MEDNPAIVPEKAKQAEEARIKWSWVEPSVWTDRMLTALEKGVKGGVWFSLIDKVYNCSNLRSAFARVKANQGGPGVDRQTIEMFEAKLEGNLERLEKELKEGTYKPQAIRRVWIEKPGRKEKRPLGIPTVRDRVVQTAIRNVVEPIFENEFSDWSYGFRPRRGCKDALRQVNALVQQGRKIVVDADLKSFFDTIPQALIMKRFKERVADGRVQALVKGYLNQGVMDGLEIWTPDQGTPQGAVISPLLANLCLNPLDHLMVQKGYALVRYADDFVILCRSREEAERALSEVRKWTEENGLILHPEKTKIVDESQPGGFEFLGYRFEQGQKRPRKKSLKKFKDSIRAKTKRNNGKSLEAIIWDINRVMKGWFEYYKHSHKWTFPKLDAWVRMRLRSILRRRTHRKGRGRGMDHIRWKNAFFAEQGLFSLAAAHAQACQSAQR
jgi:RNA-directed DNA polymerase